ncbi:MAG: ATP-binding protein [Planctomycetota bacterium]|nr:MAG: ATP-binding protein [Planctomycetota bacterium]
MDLNPQTLPNKTVIPSDLHAARDIEEQIVSAAEKLGYTEETAFAIRLALEEAIVNAHKHGNGNDSNKQITVSYDINPKRLIIRIRDQGQGFDPNVVPDPTEPNRISLPFGRGIMLMRAYLDEVTYNDKGNEVQLVKERS